MNPRSKIRFKVNNEVVVEDSVELTLEQIEAMKRVIAEECQCTYDEIDIEIVNVGAELSEEIDVGEDGMYFWKSFEFKTVQGVYCNLKEGSDAYLDALADGTLIDHLNFFI